jgi:group I intron endonuclease
MAYIYKIFNKITKKCYIGETKCKDVVWRWNQHKQKIQVNKGCPALQNSVKKYGIENFEFNVIIICFDDERFKYEREYIQKYNSVVPNDYNITNGGEGGGFQGKKHTEQVKNIIKDKLKQKYIDNPEFKTQMSERNKIVMNNPEIREKIKNGISNSEKWKKVVENMRNGTHTNQIHTHTHNEETKKKISESLKKYHSENIKVVNNLIIERDNKLGKKVKQYDMNNNLLNEYISISVASKETRIPKSTIGVHLKDKTKTGGGFIWMYA